MIYGIGIDLVEIERMDPDRMSDHVKRRLFHPDELSVLPEQLHQAKQFLASGLQRKRRFRRPSVRDSGDSALQISARSQMNWENLC